MAESTIRIIVDPSGAVRGTRVVNRSLDSVTKRAKTTTASLGFLTRAVGVLGVAFAARRVIQYADTFTQLQNRIRVTGRESDELTDATERLLQISRRTRTDLESNVSLFQRLGIAQQQLGASSEDLFNFVETVGNALSIQGAAAGTTRGAVLQLSQAIGSTVFRAEEFNSILEGAFPIALAAARGIERFGGSVSRLRSEIIKGTVTSREFFEAILSQQEALAEQFQRTTPTISQAITFLNNEMTVFIGRLDTAEGVSSSFATSLIQLALNLDNVAKGLGVVIALLAPAILARIAAGLVSIAAGITSIVLASGGFAIFISLLAGAAAAAVLFGEKLKPIEDSIATLEDLAVVTFQRIGTEISLLVSQGVDILKLSFEDLEITGGSALDSLVASVLILGEGVRILANFTINSFRAIVEATTTWFDELAKLPKAFPAIAFVINSLTADVVGFFDLTIRATEQVIALFQATKKLSLGDTGLGVPNVDVKSPLLDRLKKIFSEDVVGELSGDISVFVGNIFEELQKAAEARRRRINEEAKKPPPGGGGDDGGVATPFELTSKQVTALRQLQDELDPVGAATREVAEAEALLSDAVRAGNITKEQEIELNMLLTEAYKDALDPLAAINRELEQEQMLLGLTANAREVEIELIALENDLKTAGVKLDKEQKAELRNTLQGLQQASEALETRERIFNELRGAQEEYGKSIVALSGLQMDGTISTDEYNAAVQRLKLGLLDENDDLASGFERGLIRAAENFNDFASLAESTVTKAFKGMEDALVDFVKTGKLDFASLADSIIADLVRITIRQNIIGPLANLFAGRPAFGGNPSTGAGGTAGGAGLGSLFGSFLGGGQHGAEFTVPGVGGPDSRLVSVSATPGETISINTPGSRTGGSGGQPIIFQASFNFPGGDEGSIRRNSTQVASDAQRALADGLRRNG